MGDMRVRVPTSIRLSDDSVVSSTFAEPVRLNRRIAENFFFSPLALEPIGGEFAIDCEEGLHQRLWACVNACSMDTRTKLLSNVVLAGGNTLTAGLPELLYKKVKALGTLHVSFRQPLMPLVKEYVTVF